MFSKNKKKQLKYILLNEYILQLMGIKKYFFGVTGDGKPYTNYNSRYYTYKPLVSEIGCRCYLNVS